MASFEDVMEELRGGVFVSHISEEKPVALVLQKYFKAAFAESFPVFVSSDKTSITGGTKWFEHIITNLRFRRVLLSLVSQESRRREWINFEAGFGDGANLLVIPIAIKNFQLGQLSFPLQGYQGRSIDDIGAIVEDVGSKVGLTPHPLDTEAYLKEIRDAEAALNYKSLRLEPSQGGSTIQFQLANVGNVDLELLMIEVYIPQILISPQWTPPRYVDHQIVMRAGQAYNWYACYSSRGAYGNLDPMLRPVITPSMGTVSLNFFSIRLKPDLTEAERELAILHQIHAIGYNSSVESVLLGDIPSRS